MNANEIMMKIQAEEEALKQFQVRATEEVILRRGRIMMLKELLDTEQAKDEKEGV